AFLGGSYMAEAFRSGLEAVSKSQIESGISIGLSKTQLIRYVIIFSNIFTLKYKIMLQTKPIIIDNIIPINPS
ncbi:Polar amino acid ABC transporter, inner membrane subunit, partial [human gut metagenome]